MKPSTLRRNRSGRLDQGLHPAGPQPQRGQATTEFVVLALVLVPLFIVVPLVGKYLDVMQTAEAASRYVAFEATTRNSSNSWKTDAELAAEVRRRFFSNPNASIKTNDAAGDFAAHRNPVWSDHTGRPLIANFETDVGVKGSVTDMNAIPVTDLPLIGFRSALDLPNANLYTGAVTVKIADIANFAPFDKIGLSTSRKTVLLADAWTAHSASAVRGKIEDAVLMYPMGKLKEVIDPVGMLPTLVFDPALKVGDFDWDIVPCDRLVGGC